MVENAFTTKVIKIPFECRFVSQEVSSLFLFSFIIFRPFEAISFIFAGDDPSPRRLQHENPLRVLTAFRADLPGSLILVSSS